MSCAVGLHVQQKCPRSSACQGLETCDGAIYPDKSRGNPPGRVAKKYFLCYTEREYRPSAIFIKAIGSYEKSILQVYGMLPLTLPIAFASDVKVMVSMT